MIETALEGPNRGFVGRNFDFQQVDSRTGVRERVSSSIRGLK